MSLHPVFRTLVSQPELLAEHLGAYGELAAAEALEAVAQVKSRVALTAAALACASLGIGLAGTALLLLAVVPVVDMPAPWALAVAPGLPLAAGVGLWWARRRLLVDLSFATVREQMAMDRLLWQQVSER